MKYVILHGDGMGDWPIEGLEGQTPLEAAHTPTLDRLASLGELGLLQTIPPGLPPGSDVGSLTLFGYDPRACYTGRSPIEAAAMGIELASEDVAFRCNLVHVDFDQSPPIMVDFTSGHIGTDEARELIRALHEALGGHGIEFHAGVSYRHCMVWRGGKEKAKTTPPHDITGRPILDFLPTGEGAERLNHLMIESRAVLAEHPINRRRVEQGERPATQIWLWGQGRRPKIQPYREKFGIPQGTVVSAVDLVKGIGILCGLSAPEIPGATGWLDTNCENKVAAALLGLGHSDFAYVHLEAPDEAGHQGDVQKKVAAIEMFDQRIVGPMLRGLEKFGAYRVLIAPDHPTPISIKTHASDPVPFIYFDSEKHQRPQAHRRYTEKDAATTGLVIEEGFRCWNAIVMGQPLAV